MTTLTFGPFDKPLTVDMRDRVESFIGRAQQRGYSLVVTETEEIVKVVAVEIKEPEQAECAA